MISYKSVLDHIPTPKEFEANMKEIQKDYDHNDYEAIHSDMDWYMCEVLTKLGYGAGVHVFKKQARYYA